MPALCAAVQLPRFAAHTIAGDLKGGYQVVVADMNNDGKPDLIALASGMTELVWYENPSWKRNVIAGGFHGMINVAAMDTAGDRIPELLLAHEFSMEPKKSQGTVSLLEYQGPGKPWKRTDIDKLPASHRVRVMNGLFVNAPLANEVAAAPDYRGRIPLVFYKPGEWRRTLINDDAEGVMHGIYVVDWDGDGRQELLTASFQGIHLLKLSKDGKWVRTKLAFGSPAAWPQSGASDVAVGRVGKKRFLCAIEPWHGNEVAVYTEQKKRWQREVIDSSLVDGHTILTADLNDDRSDEIIAGFRGAGRSVNLYAREEKGWTKSPLDDGGIAAAACAVADLNGDGKPDVTCIGSATTNLKWYENVGVE